MSNTSFVVAPIAHGPIVGAAASQVSVFNGVTSPHNAPVPSSEIGTRNPAPDASPPASPGNSHRDVVICR